ncbi:hypothetical protein JB92DRAFT_2827899 [Gautieria morchelliformis]|nr:hypothetical protein JB92DRAFT_2827899 [Gautieria morchelliformis]
MKNFEHFFSACGRTGSSGGVDGLQAGIDSARILARDADFIGVPICDLIGPSRSLPSAPQPLRPSPRPGSYASRSSNPPLSPDASRSGAPHPPLKHNPPIDGLHERGELVVVCCGGEEGGGGGLAVNTRRQYTTSALGKTNAKGEEAAPGRRGILGVKRGIEIRGKRKTPRAQGEGGWNTVQRVIEPDNKAAQMIHNAVHAALRKHPNQDLQKVSHHRCQGFPHSACHLTPLPQLPGHPSLLPTPDAAPDTDADAAYRCPKLLEYRFPVGGEGWGVCAGTGMGDDDIWEGRGRFAVMDDT